MMAIMCPSVMAVVATSLGIMSGNPAAPAMAVVARHPNPIIPLMPVTAAMIVRSVADTDGEINSASFRNKRRTEGCDHCQEN